MDFFKYCSRIQKQIESLINKDFLPILEQLIEKDANEIKRECVWAVCNLTSVIKPELIKKILNQNILGIIGKCLKTENIYYNKENIYYFILN